ETFAEAAVRELREETGLEAEVQPLDAAFRYQSVHVESFIVEVAADWEPTLDWEHDDYCWLPRDEAADLLYWPEPAGLPRGLPCPSSGTSARPRLSAALRLGTARSGRSTSATAGSTGSRATARERASGPSSRRRTATSSAGSTATAAGASP